MDKHISQREARRLKRENARLQSILSGQRKDWRGEWPDHVAVLGRLVKPGNPIISQVDTARRLQHAVVVTVQDNDLLFFGCKAD